MFPGSTKQVALVTCFVCFQSITFSSFTCDKGSVSWCTTALFSSFYFLDIVYQSFQEMSPRPSFLQAAKVVLEIICKGEVGNFMSVVDKYGISFTFTSAVCASEM